VKQRRVRGFVGPIASLQKGISRLRLGRHFSSRELVVKLTAPSDLIVGPKLNAIGVHHWTIPEPKVHSLLF